MGVFCVLLFVPIFMQHLVVQKEHVDYEKKNKTALTFFFWFFIILVMLRHSSIGNDTQGYINFFKQCASLGWKNISIAGIEIGYAYFQKIISLFTDNVALYML